MKERNFQGFESLEVWQLGCRMSIDTYTALKDLRDFGFRDQICRSAVSIPSNIAEGYERNGAREFIRFLNIAKGSCGEFKTQVYIAERIGYLAPGAAANLLSHARSIAAMLSSLIKRLHANNANG
jgi:four helix bundle protein